MDHNAHAQHMRRHRRFAIPLHLEPVTEVLAKRLTPEQLISIQREMSISANAANSDAVTTTLRSAAATTRVGANAATLSTTIRSTVSSFAAVPTYSVAPAVSSVRSTAATSAVITPSSVRPSSVAPSSSAIPSSASPSSTSNIATLPPVVTHTIPLSSSSTSSSSAQPSVSVAAASSSSSSSSMSTGAVVGIVLAALVGVVIVGSFAGWLYRKFAGRGYKADSKWNKLDDDISPFPMEKDENYNDDIYGGSAAPVIGSRRALADHAGRDASYPSSRPLTDYANNRAGLGSGPDAFAAYPAYPSAYGDERSYHGQAGRPAQPQYHDEYDYSVDGQAPASPPTTRQLVGPGYSPPQLVPVAMGRPAAPRSYSDMALVEDFADEPMSAGMPYEPMTARTNEWAGNAQPLRRNSPPSLAPMPLPTFAPLSPFASNFDLPTQAPPPLAMYENEPARQKQLYGEVAAFAGFPEPKTPHSAGLDNAVSSHGDTFNTGTTHSSLSATEHGVRLPTQPPVPSVPVLNFPAPQYSQQPYEHGRPLSPLVEVATPSTFRSANPLPVPSSSIGLGGHNKEYNPFDNLPTPRTLLAPHSAASSGANSFPSAKYPPPSPGGLSLPASVTDSPRRWSGQGNDNVGMARRSRGESMFDGEDAYGGI